MKTLQQSDKGSFAMACYPGYLLARESWAFMKCTLLIIDRYFCNEGGTSLHNTQESKSPD
jgi:hypothetical protein